MKTLKELFRIGQGPSSSHTMGPRMAAQQYLIKHPEALHFRVTLYGSLAATGKGHLTDRAILDVLGEDRTEIVWHPEIVLDFHPNGMRFETISTDGQASGSWLVFSVGGGALAEDGDQLVQSPDIYELDSLLDIKHWCEQRGKSYWEYVEEREGKDIWDYLEEVWMVMKAAVERGLEHEGVLPGCLKLRRKAPDYYIKAMGYNSNLQTRGLVFAYALAVSEENASGGRIVTAPTCGACGVVPAVLYHIQKSRKFPDRRILHALATAGLVGNVAKSRASISGAEAGCQAEVGVACAMAAAAANYIFGGSLATIEYSAEMGLEHHLGMTCDPICGLVQIPCIERNAHAAARALDANIYATYAEGLHRISYDKAVDVMKQTGHDLPSLYRETSTGGLAKEYES
ncbi:MAG: L-serine ammonia-lyase, iron-sulfur-dependent, subunit alpha [Alloprevotella sp.]|nr:L-serine ammonia-lyase, iron-sulfur-dependent, subunit alpha [Prevotellamassilia sp.]MCI6144287.1 L-serine ammonia-lyase, iron-sulfur-dependent, subunit alpha [Bacteroidales bacterium]MDY2623796.1 L-serine ammonia-lyase, iron-sulfur-dependent, subunit alpha [Alloprevotella sp.]MDD7564721.1 L-serine ammonia-lyase, iron-sulfur-dependent, subunit alpha [Prevotellamassilia sp.]MDY2779350.1 L-serine ammonia-lyase, iron-sulfur-dependent, subunit alpha [Alloprevotella sp.]